MAQTDQLATLAALKSMASSGFLAITLLNVFSAVCVLYLAKGHVDDMWLKASVLPLPVAFLPLGISAIMMGKLADGDEHALGCTAGFVLAEFIYVYVLGAITVAAMTETSAVGVVVVTILCIVITVLVWRCSFKYPKFLRAPTSSFGNLSTLVNFTKGNDLEKRKLGMEVSLMSERVRNEDLVIKHPMLAQLINYCFNAFFVIELVVYIVLVFVFFNVSKHCWQLLLSIVFVSPIYLLPLHSVSILRDGYIKKFAMGPRDSDNVVGKM